MFILSKILNRLIKRGTLTVVDACEREHVFTGSPVPAVSMRLKTRLLPYKLALNPHLYLGEAYMDGTLTVEGGNIYDLLDLLTLNLGTGRRRGFLGKLARAYRMIFALGRYNPVRRSKRNAAHHYDLPDKLYDLFLDDHRQYSCAYYRRPDDTLEQAQAQKMAHIAAKLCLQPGDRVLDIGCGWGGLSRYLADSCDAKVTGITLSREQLDYARAQAEIDGLSGRTRFDYRDYREIADSYDRIVSVGMFEHVGPPHYRRFFKTVHDALNDNGIALIHTIGDADPPSAMNSWIRKYVFPGGYIPSLSEIVPEIEGAGLNITDIEILRLHYAATLRAWRQRFSAKRDRVRAMMGERFCRMWEFYLAVSEVAFERRGHVVFQIQLAKRQEGVPLTRDYLARFENQALRKTAMAA